MGEMTLFGSFNRTVPAGLLSVSRLARLGAHLSVALRGWRQKGFLGSFWGI